MMPNNILQSLLTLQKRLESFNEEDNEMLIVRASNANAWFTPAYIVESIHGLAQMLSEKDLVQAIEQRSSEKNIGVILAGNIPAVGFQDILYVLLAGSIAHVKLSTKDEFLIRYLVDQLIEIDASFSDKVKFTEKLVLDELDGVVATGSDNTARYFEQYFSRVPHVIRKNRTSVAVLTGNESQEELEQLALDVILYFGLGCRNVTKLYTPEEYDFTPFLKIIEDNHKEQSFHSKYHNNYDYYKAIYLVECIEHLDNGVLLLKQDESVFSPLSVLYHESYATLDELKGVLETKKGQIQVVVSSQEKMFERQVGFGKAQSPGLFDFPDGENILTFIHSI
ncbi:acyl-CoA reductase [Cyclobacteriaceae bacterium]|nr:acyl-CoA reductase [Cyclobacteriaceae bacterium]